ncbi:MarR family protein [Pigmentiphaga humi]|uniref:MarR family protein n=1 Tax=Pigmentiphaga humi TaxID=2478468 RepID=A0A3P4AZ04_9BURK|nr:MarR family transcriptional regulator [Pigmentiphaga humi]VCU68628.1 MarR family protein [Pigmentiphaga humi]
MNTNPRAVAVADARYLMRLAFRMIDDEARRAGVEPLEHQLLVQLQGSRDGTRSVSELAVRLDVSLALSSRLAARLERRELVVRIPSSADRRVTLIRATAAGNDVVHTVSAAVQRRFRHLRAEFSPQMRQAALTVWANNFGVRPS